MGGASIDVTHRYANYAVRYETKGKGKEKNMTNTEYLMAIAAEVGVNVDELPDTLETTLLKAIIEKSGGDTSALPDNLKSTLYTALAECAGSGGGSIDELKANGQIGYTETQEVEAIPEQTIEVAMNEDLGGALAIVAPAYDFSGVQKVRVLFDGVEYICTPLEGGFGNTALLGGEDTGEPFFYAPADGYNPSSAGFFVAAEGTHTVSVTAISELVHPVNAKYLPVINLTTAVPDFEGTRVTLSEAEHAELYAAAKTGVPVAIRLHFADTAMATETLVFELQDLFNGSYDFLSNKIFVVSVSSGWIDMIFNTCTISLSSDAATLSYKKYEKPVLIKS